ncbi:MAG: hypothetical protein ACLFNQ_11845, partial [Spirochaetaceae bacterium]
MGRTSRIMLLLVLIVILAACAPGTARFEADEDPPAGFFWGVWHGWIAPVSLVWQLFNRSVGVYEANNSGFWYDLGFYLAIVGGFGGLSFTRKK